MTGPLRLGVAGLDARLGAAQAWIALHFALRRAAIVDGLEQEAHLRSEAIRGRFGAGGATLDETVVAAIDAAQVEDRKAEAAATVAGARAALRRWIGDAANAPLAPEQPAFHIDAAHLRDHIERHPSLAAYQAERALADANVAMARSETRSDWSWEASYGRRDPSFGDLASVGVRIGLPLFQGSRQKPIVEARRFDAARVVSEREAALREHTALLEQRLAEYAALSANLTRARDVRLPLARQRAAAAIGAHGAGAGSVTQLIDARAAALEAEIDVVNLEERLALIGAALTLEYGETTP